jgi:hypothetical protein
MANMNLTLDPFTESSVRSIDIFPKSRAKEIVNRSESATIEFLKNIVHKQIIRIKYKKFVLLATLRHRNFKRGLYAATNKNPNDIVGNPMFMLPLVWRLEHDTILRWMGLSRRTKTTAGSTDGRMRYRGFCWTLTRPCNLCICSGKENEGLLLT